MKKTFVIRRRIDLVFEYVFYTRDPDNPRHTLEFKYNESEIGFEEAMNVLEQEIKKEFGVEELELECCF